MSIPLNGRIAIIENELKEAMPLMKTFSKNQIPYVFYKGDDFSFLPDENSRFNDIRVLFLDLIDDTVFPEIFGSISSKDDN